MGIILMSFLPPLEVLLCLLTPELVTSEVTDLGMGARPLLARGTNEGAALTRGGPSVRERDRAWDGMGKGSEAI